MMYKPIVIAALGLSAVGCGERPVDSSKSDLGNSTTVAEPQVKEDSHVDEYLIGAVGGYLLSNALNSNNQSRDSQYQQSNVSRQTPVRQVVPQYTQPKNQITYKVVQPSKPVTKPRSFTYRSGSYKSSRSSLGGSRSFSRSGRR